jgi:hypothetical protein
MISGGNKNMAFETVATIPGAPASYKISAMAKRFTLRDNGFEETAAGNYQLTRSVDASTTSGEGYKLKITVARDLKTLKMSVTTKDGLRSVNIFKNEQLAANQEQFNFILAGLVERGVLTKA